MSGPSGRPLHVLHVLPTLGAGGIELALSRVVAGLAAPRFRHTVVCIKGEAEIADHFAEDVPIHCMRSRDNELGLPRRLRRLLREVRPDVVHARNWSAWPDVAVARLGLRPRIPLVFSFHGTDRAKVMPWRRRAAFRALFRITDQVFTVAEASRRLLADQVGLPPERIAILPNGVDTIRFSPREGPRPGGAPLVIGSVGNLTPVKNQALLVRAAARLRAEGRDVLVRIAGEGPEREPLLALAEAEGLGERLVLPGRRADVPGFLRELDLFVLCSDSEAHPNALIEAMAAGIPVIATRVGGVSEVLRGGHDGRIVGKGEVEELAAALREIADDPALAATLAGRGRERAVARYGMERMIEDYGALYREVAAGGRWHAPPEEPWPGAAPAPRRVLMVGPGPEEPGGMAAVVAGLLRGPLAERHRLSLFDNAKRTAPDRSLLEGLRSQRGLLSAFDQELARRRPEVVHFHTCSGVVFWRDVFYARRARRRGARVVFHVHGGFFDRFLSAAGPLRRRVARRALERADAVLVLSHAWLGRLRPFAPGARWQVLPNGVPLLEPPADPGRPRPSPRFLFLGNLSPEKGVLDLAAAVARARDLGWPGEVRLAGHEQQPGQREALLDRLEALGVGDRVTLLGTIRGEAKEAELREAAALVLPSHVEALPMAVLEAMAAGLPVLATRVGAIPEVVTDGREGRLVAAGDVEALAAGLVELAADPELRRRLGAAGRARIAADLTRERVADRLDALYRGLAGDPAVPGPAPGQ